MKVKFVLIGVFSALIFAYCAQADQPEWSFEGYDQFLKWRQEQNERLPQTLDSEAEHNYDVKAYYIYLDVDITGEYIQGYCTVTMESTIAGLDTVELDLRSLTVTDCEFNGSSASYSQDTYLITIYLPSPQNPGIDFDVTVYYEGNPADGMFFDTDPVCAFTLTEPTESRFWYPCYDDPSDKADHCDVVITVDGDYEVAGNGLEVWRSYSGGRTISHWYESHPIPTYLVAVAICDYSVLEDSYQGMPLKYYVYPGEESDAWIAFEHTSDMFDLFNDIYSTYPFQDEKYAIAELPFGGGMEQTTCCFLGEYWVMPSHSSDWILAHELSHQWWGDWVTCGTWMDIWLNEGFATYSDALFAQYFYGEEAFQNRMQNFADAYFEEDSWYRFPIYDPLYMWGATVYEKGAWILHMMRRVFDDDEQFFQMLRNYGNAHAYSTAITSEFQTAVEAGYGDDFSWFFDEWVYLAGYPEIEYGWTADGNTATLYLYQVQEVDDLTPLFEMPVDVRLTTTAGAEDFEIWMSQESETFEFTASGEVTNLEFDPDNWLLCTKDETIDVALHYFSATATASGINLSWEISSDEEIFGFNLYHRLLDTDADQTPESIVVKSNANSSGAWSKINEQPITGENPYSYLDRGVFEGKRYEYRLEVIIIAGKRTIGNTEVIASTTPGSFALLQNYPNPWSETTTVTFTLPEACEISLGIYDISGRLVKEVACGYYQSGEHQLTLDNSQLSSGVYVLRLSNSEQVAFSKMVFAK